MPLTDKGNKILASMSKTYGPERAKRVFYASINKGTITGVEKNKREGGVIRKQGGGEIAGPSGVMGQFGQAGGWLSHILPYILGQQQQQPGQSNPWLSALFSRMMPQGMFGNQQPMNIVPPQMAADSSKYQPPPPAPEQSSVPSFRGNLSRGLISAGLQQMANANQPPWQRYGQPPQQRLLPGFAPGGGISPTVSTPWYARSAAYNLARGPKKGLLDSSVPGRTDKLPIKVASGSYVLPADVVSALGQGNTKAGAVAVQKKFKSPSYGAGKFRMPRMPGLKRGTFAEGGTPKDVPIIAAGGEIVLSPEEVARYGKGDVKHGHDKLDKFVLKMRKKHIETLKNLKPPRKD